jgi:hypothetical protein
MKTELQKHLATIAPQVAIRTYYQTDDDAWNEWDEMTKPGNCMEGERPEHWCAWQASIEAATVTLGELRTGTAYLGGNWERVGECPYKSNPTISGYEKQMTEEALQELRDNLDPEAVLLADQITAALKYLTTL